MKRLEILRVHFAEVTLHTGLGNFRPIEVEDLTKHKVDSEEMFINQKTADMINRALDKKHKVCAVGTTSMKALESAVSITGKIKPFSGWTNKFIFPPYDFKTANAMITNFHLPLSPLLMMVSAYMEYDFTKRSMTRRLKRNTSFLPTVMP